MVSQKVLPVSGTLKWPSPTAPESQMDNSKKFWVHQNGLPLCLKRNAFPRQKFNSSIHLWLSAPQLGRMAKNNTVASFFIHLKWCIIGLLATRNHSQSLGQVRQRHSNYGMQRATVRICLTWSWNLFSILFPPCTAVSQDFKYHSSLVGWKEWLSKLSTWLLCMSSTVSVTLLLLIIWNKCTGLNRSVWFYSSPGRLNWEEVTPEGTSLLTPSKYQVTALPSCCIAFWYMFPSNSLTAF